MKPHFRIVQFSSAPEFKEFVNVAVLVVDEKPRLLVDEAFAKLGCIDPQFDRELLKDWLQDLGDQVRRADPETVDAIVRSSSPQVRASSSFPINPSVGRQVEQALVDLYLKRPSPRTPIATEAQRFYIDSLIERFMTTAHAPFMRVLRRVGPSDFLRPETRQFLKNNSFKVSRVIDGAKKLILIDGLNLGVARVGNRIRAQEIGYAFYSMASVRTKVRELESRDLVRTAILFNHTRAVGDPKLEYAVESLRRDSDLLVDADTSDDMVKFEQAVQDADPVLQ
jgi:hypothetical protein